MSNLIEIRELNREAARCARLKTALDTIVHQLANEGVDIEEKNLTYIDEIMPPKYDEKAIGFLVLNGIRVASTAYSQHLFMLDTDQANRL